MMGPFGQFGGGMGWGGWVAMALAMVVFWGLIATAVALIIRSVGHRRGAALAMTDGVAAPRETDERAASGEAETDE